MDFTKEQLQEMSSGSMPSFLKEDENRRQRWEHLTKGLNPYQRLVVENLIENARRWAVRETTSTGNIQTFTTYAFPIIRRVFPNLIANELVSVQPIPQPTGKIFYYDLEYGSETAGSEGVSVGDRIDLQTNFNPLYSGGRVRQEFLGYGDGTVDTWTAKYAPIRADSLTAYVDGVEVALGGGTDLATGTIELDAAPGDGAAVTVDYTVTGAEESATPREIDLRITDDTVEAESKKLRTRWTLEAQQDLMAYHGLSIESELLAGLSDSLRREIDRIIIEDLVNHASAANVTWNRAIPQDYEGSDREWRMTLYDAILDANNEIYKRRYRNANWIVADPDSCAELEKLDGFTEVKQEWAGGSGMGVERFGILRNRFQVFKDPWMRTDTMLLGFKGATMFETGYIYAPYIPLYVTPVIMDTDFEPRRAVMTRYACKPVITDYYATVGINR